MHQPRLEIYHTEDRGDCLFDSVRIVLQSERIYTTNQELRRIVADTVLDLSDRDATSAIQLWKMSYMAGMAAEFQHVRNVVRQGEDPAMITINDRRLIFSNMLCPNLYWGDEYALRIMEREFHVVFLLFTDLRLKPVVPLDHEPNHQFTHYIMLYLSRIHYQPVSYGSRFLFQPEQLPDFLKPTTLSLK